MNSLLRKRLAAGLRAPLWLAAGIAWLWALFALGLFPAWPPWARGLALCLAVGLAAGLFVKVPRRFVPWATLAGALVVRLLWSINVPSNDRNWTKDQVRTPAAEFDGNRVTVRNVRNAVYRTVHDYDVAWEVRTYDLELIDRVDYVVEPFSSWRGLAHTFLSFGFEDGEHVAISIEIRKEEGETYSPLKGLFRHFESTYVVGDERDLIGLRANIRQNPVRLYPVAATREQIRALFVSMLERANRVAEEPEFYNTWLNTCATAMLRHVNELRTNKVGFTWRMVFPGYSDELAWDLGLIDYPGAFDEARERFLINGRSEFLGDGRAWSKRIRTIADDPSSPR